MIEILRKEYWSKSRLFLLPLTGITKIPDFEFSSYIRWEGYSIQNYELIVKVTYGYRYEVFQEYIKTNLVSNKKSFAKEIYDYEGFSLIIFDISEWKDDVDLFLQGKYSRFSSEAKKEIESFYTIYKNNRKEIGIITLSCLYPNLPLERLDNMTPLDYVIKHYVRSNKRTRVDRNTERTWRKLGELCSKCNEYNESLILDDSQLGIPIQLD